MGAHDDEIYILFLRVSQDDVGGGYAAPLLHHDADPAVVSRRQHDRFGAVADRAQAKEGHIADDVRNGCKNDATGQCRIHAQLFQY